MSLIGSRAGMFPYNPDVDAPASMATPKLRPQDIAAPDVGQIKRGGIFDRIGDFLGSDQGRAALLRSGAATINGGLGAGIAAGAGYLDDQKAIGRQQQQQQFENNLATNKQSLGWQEFQQKMELEHAKQLRDANKIHYTTVPEGGTMVATYGDGSLVDPAAAAPYVQGGGAAPQQNLGPPKVTAAGDYARLPAGATYVGPDGKVRRKGGAPSLGGAGFP